MKFVLSPIYQVFLRVQHQISLQQKADLCELIIFTPENDQETYAFLIISG